jgi:hypothetical protein
MSTDVRTEASEATICESQSVRVIEADRATRKVWVDLIEVGMGNARDRRLYTKQLLEHSADVLVGAKMFADHESPEQAKKRNGLPRSVRDLAGRVVEARYVPDGGTSGNGSIQGLVSVGPSWLWELIEADPELVGLSINGSGRVRQEMGPDGKPANLVEAITAIDSVDWVSAAGAGGRVLELAEAETGDDMEDDEVSLDDITFEQLMDARPDLVRKVEEEYASMVLGGLDEVLGDEEALKALLADEEATEATEPVASEDPEPAEEPAEDAEEEPAAAEAVEEEPVLAGVTEADFVDMLEAAEERGIARAESIFRQKMNQLTVKELLMESSLPELSADAIAREFHDFDGDEDTLVDLLKESIREKKRELSAAGRRGVSGVGLSAPVLEGAEQNSESTAHADLMRDLGLPIDEVI